jgi:DNA-directed RNA polymerase specialized sigma24 family protein
MPITLDLWHLAALVEQVQSGDRRAERDVIDLVLPTLEAVVRNRLWPPLRRRVDVEQIALEVAHCLLCAARSGRTWAAPPALWAYVVRLARWRAGQANRDLRRRKRWIDRECESLETGASPEPLTPRPGPDELARAADSAAWALEQLEPVDRIIWSMYLEGYHLDEIARHIGCAPRTTGRHLKRVRDLLRRRGRRSL